VVGAVVRPGALDYQQGYRLSDYLALAGGPTNRAVLRKSVLKQLYRGGSVVSVMDLRLPCAPRTAWRRNPCWHGRCPDRTGAFLAGTLEWSDILRAVVAPWL